MTQEIGRKDDTDKSPVFQGAFQYFPKALLEVARVSAHGANKYAWGNWKRNMPDGIIRITNAMGRHILAESGGEAIDPETKLLHAAHTAWNALARLELLLQATCQPEAKRASKDQATQTRGNCTCGVPVSACNPDCINYVYEGLEYIEKRKDQATQTQHAPMTDVKKLSRGSCTCDAHVSVCMPGCINYVYAT